MKATQLEYRHQTLLHLLLVGLSLSAYWLNPDDVVWAAVRGHSDRALLERLVFGAGAFMLLGSALLETWGNAYQARYPKRWARILLVLAVGQLLPLPGLVTLFAGESLLMVRLVLRDRPAAVAPARVSAGSWGPAFRAAVSKWGLAVSMIAFAWTLQGRIAEIGAAFSFVIWLILNLPRPRILA